MDNRKIEKNVQTITANGIFHCLFFKIFFSCSCLFHLLLRRIHGLWFVSSVYISDVSEIVISVYGNFKLIDVLHEPTKSYIFYAHFTAWPFHMQGFLNLCKCPGLIIDVKFASITTIKIMEVGLCEILFSFYKKCWFMRSNKNQMFYWIFSPSNYIVVLAAYRHVHNISVNLNLFRTTVIV